MTRYGMFYQFILAIFLAFLTAPAFAEGEATEGLMLAHAKIDPTDTKSIERGAKFFAATCMSCHTLIYLRYNKLANDAGITYEKMPINVKNWPNGVKPPDLSLEADVRGVDWIYTYLHSFYKDTTRPTGVNNLLVPNTSMPNIVAGFQGEQEFVAHPVTDLFNGTEYFDWVKLVKQGSMSPNEFDATIADVVNFLNYAAAPYQAEQHRIGYWVILFLIVMSILLYLLKREYWKDVKKMKE
jgi:ubiquinol-cytochrome c reductase cytochrome c1 subunit